jgi:asparagine synthase (glutamine-hydrolysing)
MSVQFGRWNFDGRPVNRDHIETAERLLAPYGPDDQGAYAATGIHILYRGLSTAKEASRESQPFPLKSGAVLTWDGRLDNRLEIISQLRDCLTTSSTDISIVAACYEESGVDCFAKLSGDWALSIWDTKAGCLLLAKDPIGPRPLYYSMEEDSVTWSTLLDPLILHTEKSLTLSEEYVAGWLALLPAAHLTPFAGIQAIPPSSFVRIQKGKHCTTKYWDFDPAKTIRYRTDAEYEEHFRSVFAQSVRRRLLSGRPILAELSGGMDSSSIVCMADRLVRQGLCPSASFQTISYIDPSEPNWNELPFVNIVEKHIGRAGIHIDLAPQNPWTVRFSPEHFAPTPATNFDSSLVAETFRENLRTTGAGAILSGIAGDEVLGGLPTPVPELADLVWSGRLAAFAISLVAWSLAGRRPLYRLVAETLESLVPRAFSFGASRNVLPQWLSPQFAGRCRTLLPFLSRKVRRDHSLPSFRTNLACLESLRSQIACSPIPRSPVYETRYPYLDQDLLQFLFAIPREQLVRPRERRSLMRRALRDVVPAAVLERRRKAFVVRGPLASIESNWNELKEATQHMLSSALGLVDEAELRSVLRKAFDGHEIPVVLLVRTLAFERWLHHLKEHGLALAMKSLSSRTRVSPLATGPHRTFDANQFSAETIQMERR